MDTQEGVLINATLQAIPELRKIAVAFPAAASQIDTVINQLNAAVEPLLAPPPPPPPPVLP